MHCDTETENIGSGIGGENSIMAFQVVELTLDADDNVIERSVVPYPYQTRAEAVDTIESVIMKICGSRLRARGGFLVGHQRQR